MDLRVFCVTLLYVVTSHPDVTVAQGMINPAVPVLSRPPGTRYPLGQRSGEPRLQLEAFIELNCEDSQAALPVLQRVADHYTTERLELIIHQLPLPYHRNGLALTQGLFVIRDNVPDRQFDYMRVMLGKVNLLSTEATRTMGDDAVINRISRFAAKATGINRELFKQEIHNYNREARNVWKFAVARGIAGTPWYFVNGVDLGVSPSITLTFQDWITFLDPLIITEHPAGEADGEAVSHKMADILGRLRGDHA